jgi:hypothetical protein
VVDGADDYGDGCDDGDDDPPSGLIGLYFELNGYERLSWLDAHNFFGVIFALKTFLAGQFNSLLAFAVGYI